MSAAVCKICPHYCKIEEGRRGLCGARENRGGVIVDENYGKLTSLALDPIEKKPLRRFHPGGLILSAGSYGCNFRCPFCQNYEISTMHSPGDRTVFIPPEVLAQKALELRAQGNTGIAFTYNEPTVSFEYVRDCEALNRKNGLANVLVTNGYLNEGPLRELLAATDAMNIDLKSFSEDFYRRIGGGLEEVKRTIELSAAQCHVEVTTLVIPGGNDSPEEMRKLSGWLASVDPRIPLHVTRFFPRYRMLNRGPTPVETIHSLAGVARESLAYVYEGNI